MRAASGLVLAIIGLLSMWFGGTVWTVCIAILGIGMAAEWVGLCRRRRTGLWPLGLAYILPAVVALIWLRHGPGGFRRLLFLAAVIWAGDIGAYLVGRLLGGPRLAPRVSPGKTWSGAAGGTVCAVLAGMAVDPAHPMPTALLALVLSVVAQAGDLLESGIKRYFGAKDSGSIIPGHGGLLDRLDGVLAAAPAAALWSLASGQALLPWR